MEFSVIIPIYNSESYLKTSIRSVLEQTLSFREHIELILINDGSTDSTDSICLNYQRKFPDNIKYKFIRNSGPAHARNIGLNLVSTDSKFVVFLDADDKFDRNALIKVKIFFSENPNLKIATIPVFYFENGNGPHALNYRFHNGSRIIDIQKEYSAPHYYIGGVFIKREYVIQHQIRFNESLFFWEDALFVNKIIISEKIYGVVADTKYWYRKRKSKNSLVDISWKNKYRYTGLLQTGYKAIIELSLEVNNVVLEYVQYLVIYHMRLFFNNESSLALINILDNKEIQQFTNEINSILRFIDDKHILEQNILFAQKSFLLQLKHGLDFHLNQSVEQLAYNSSINLTQIKISGIQLKISGCFQSPHYLAQEIELIFVKLGSKIVPSVTTHTNGKISIWGQQLKNYNHTSFHLLVPIWCLRIQFGIRTKKHDILLNKMNLLSIIKEKAKEVFKKYLLKK